MRDGSQRIMCVQLFMDMLYQDRLGVGTEIGMFSVHFDFRDINALLSKYF